LLRNSITCRRCLRFIAYGKDAPPGGSEIEWIEACDWCLGREAERRAQVAQLEEMWAARVCAAPDCEVAFTPATSTQRFHSDACRKRTHRRAKAGLI
jgi:hypothetical protein